MVFKKSFRKVHRKFQGDFDLNAVPYSDLYDFTERELEENDAIMRGYDEASRLEIKTANWFVPPFSSVTGGIVTIYKFAKLLHEKGVKNRFIVFGVSFESREDVKSRFQRSFPDLGDPDVFVYGKMTKRDIQDIPYSDIAFATRWDSAYVALKFNKTKAKFYLMQDFEPLFYPAGKQYALAEQTYRFGFVGIVSSLGLFNEYKNYNNRCDYFIPPVDRDLYFPKEKSSKVINIVFYGRPTSLRNGFDLGIGALKKVKEKYGDKVSIFSVGEDWEESKYGLRGIVKNFGFVSVKELADVYRNSHIGLAFVFTKHPSFQPLEMMASGAAAVTNFNESNLWIYKNMENCLLALPSESCVAEAIGRLVDDPALRERVIKKGFETIKMTNWEDELESMWKFMTEKKKVNHG